MRRVFFLFAVLFMLAGCQEKTTVKVVDTYENGQPRVVQYVNKEGVGVKETHYYEDGAVFAEGPIKNGLREGAWTGYFPDGKVQSTGFFEHGQRTGDAKVYWSSGNLYMEGAYREGKRVGNWKYYDEQGYFDMEVFLGD